MDTFVNDIRTVKDGIYKLLNQNQIGTVSPLLNRRTGEVNVPQWLQDQYGILYPVVDGIAQIANLSKLAGAFPTDSYWIDDIQAAITNKLSQGGFGSAGSAGTRLIVNGNGSNVQICASDGSSNVSWYEFDSNGTMSLPNGGQIINFNGTTIVVNTTGGTIIGSGEYKATVAARTSGNIDLVANDGSDGDNSGKTWTFDNTGNLLLPNIGGTIESSITTVNGALQLRSNMGAELDYYDSADENHFGYFSIDGTGTYLAQRSNVAGNVSTVEWNFKPTGETIFPLLNTARGDNPSGTIYGYTINIGDGQQEGVITTPDGTEGNPYAQRLVINPGKGQEGSSGEGGDIYLWAGYGENGGDIKVDGGNASSGEGGTIKIRGGYSNTGTGGFVEISAGTGIDSFKKSVFSV